MMIAQQLYEGVELRRGGPVGLITYMRTDSARVVDDAIDGVREYIGAALRRRLPARRSRTSTRPRRTRRTRTKRSGRRRCSTTPKRVQRATSTPDQFRALRADLEPLRRVADAAGDFDETTVDIAAGRTTCSASRARCRSSPAGWPSTARARPRRSRSEAGRRAEAARTRTSGDVPAAAARRATAWSSCELRPEQKFTQPPPRFTEATLVKELEENGIGRPRTYASIITRIQAREYVNKIEGRFKPTDARHDLVTELLARRFDDILDVEYTAQHGRGARQDRGGQDRADVEDARRASTRSSRRT